MMTRKNKYMIAYFVTMALLIGYAVFFCIEMNNLAKWTENEQALIIPIGILTGIGFFISQDLWEELKKEKKK